MTMIDQENGSLKFLVIARDPKTRARAGILQTRHGEVPTPVFMPVGTQGTVKAMGPDDLARVGASMILANTYHLLIRPGPEVVRDLGSLHGFMAWDGPILTDSGGYQVFSLTNMRKLTEEGVVFRSHLDGTEINLTPERAVEIQETLGPDIMMAFDECTAYPASYDETAASADLTHRWAVRCQKAQKSIDGPALFGIVQGGMFPELRRKSALEMRELDFPGLAIGGLALGEDQLLRLEMIQAAVEVLPEEKPLYLMGLGKPEDLVEGIAAGSDMFDCVMPTRNARNGQLFTKTGRLVIKNNRYRLDEKPVEEDCSCYTCQKFSRGYLRHLIMAKEILAYRLNTIHNLHYYLNLVKQARQAIIEGKFTEFYNNFYDLRGGKKQSGGLEP